MKKLLCLLVVMFLAVNASAAVWVGTDTSGGTTAGNGIWGDDINNWVTNDTGWVDNPALLDMVPVTAVPSSSSEAVYLLGQFDGTHDWPLGTSPVWGPAIVYPDFNPGPVTINAPGAQASQVSVGLVSYSQTLNVTSTGTLDVAGEIAVGLWCEYSHLNNYGTINAGTLRLGTARSNNYIDNYGTINVTGDLLYDTTYDAHITMHSGTMNIGGNIDMATTTWGLQGSLHLDGGTITAGALLYDASGWQDLVDITEGVLILDGDVRGSLNFWTSPIGEIPAVMRAYGGAGTVMYDYDITTPGKTTVWAVPEPATMMLLGLGAVLIRRRK